jgi:hypothetical protein
MELDYGFCDTIWLRLEGLDYDFLWNQITAFVIMDVYGLKNRIMAFVILDGYGLKDRIIACTTKVCNLALIPC